MDFNDYQAQINELLLIRQDPNFNELFNRILANESASDKFLIKMEINRLSKPCQRIIDLRGKVAQECLPVNYLNIQHYLDKDCKEVFENSIQLYEQYTIGTFESVMAHHLKTKKTQQTSKKASIANQTPPNQQCELIFLSEKNKRAAPRMFFVSEIEIELENGRRYFAQTTNISISGLKIKLKNPIKINNGEIIQVTFSGFKKEFTDTREFSAARYQLVGQQKIENVQYCHLNYIGNDQHLITFIQKFIQINQCKYKIDVHYYSQQAKNKLLTNFYLANTSKLPVYLNSRSVTPYLFALENNKNKEVISYWQSPNKNNLISLFNELRLLRLLSLSDSKQETILYSFTYVNNGVCYYLSATEEELLEKEMKELFIHYGHSKDSWRVYNLSLLKYRYESDAMNPTIAQQKYDLLNNITHIAILDDITQTTPLPNEINNSKNDYQKLNQFVLHKNTDKDHNIFQLFPVIRRQEPRYLYKSNIAINFAEKNYPAQILNFSLSGLKIKLETPLNIPNNSRLIVNLIDFQKISNKFPLSKLTYTMLNYGLDNTLNLKVADKKTKQISKNFFSLLIQNNKKHFKRIPIQREHASFSDELKKVVEASHLGCVLFVAEEGYRANIKYASIDKQNKELKELFTLLSDDANAINVTPITNNHLYKRLISQPLKSQNTDSILKEALIYIKVKQNRRQEWTIKSYLDEDFKSTKERNDFIAYSKFSAQIYVLHYRLTSLDSPDFTIVQDEMNTISRFALHLAKNLTKEMQTMRGMIEIRDCTNIFEKLSRLK
ncbi:MAG: PilZ domain-containing protein [Psychromonas sp.]|nr:PilZ domain-containing protein [Psychromonas sp.]